MTGEEQGAFDAVAKFLDDYSRRDIESCMNAVAASTPVLMFGTNENEVMKTPDEIRSAFERDFDSMADTRWGKYRNVYVRAASTLACVIIEAPISYQSEGKRVETLFRYALTVVREGNQWKICAGLTSVPFSAGTYSFPREG